MHQCQAELKRISVSFPSLHLCSGHGSWTSGIDCSNTVPGRQWVCGSRVEGLCACVFVCVFTKGGQSTKPSTILSAWIWRCIHPYLCVCVRKRKHSPLPILHRFWYFLLLFNICDSPAPPCFSPERCVKTYIFTELDPENNEFIHFALLLKRLSSECPCVQCPSDDIMTTCVQGHSWWRTYRTLTWICSSICRGSSNFYQLIHALLFWFTLTASVVMFSVQQEVFSSWEPNIPQEFKEGKNWPKCPNKCYLSTWGKTGRDFMLQLCICIFITKLWVCSV